jgi:hypothetical protein
MAAVAITISGVLYDKYNRTSQVVTLVGEASLTGLGVDGGPIIPPDQPGQPPMFPNVPPHPAFPIAGPGPFPPGSGYPPVVGGGPIVPQPPLPPEFTPPAVGEAPKPLPPPPGTPGWPTADIVPPPYAVYNYPGVGPIVVAPPSTSATTPPG